jgi:hypothetical protein
MSVHLTRDLHSDIDAGLRYGMAERQLVLLKHVNHTPVLAKCSGCELKFFVPKELMKDPDAVRSYLLSKFDEHSCRFGDRQTRTLPRNRW